MTMLYRLNDLAEWSGGRDTPIRLGVFGDPVAHSLSPQMQNAALVSCELPIRYERFHIRPDELAAAIHRARELEFVGLNLTFPHKTDGMRWVDKLDDSARDAGSLNTIVLRDRTTVGFNTDGFGFVAAVREVWPELELRNIRVLVLGTGGAGRAIVAGCAAAGCKNVVVWNRTRAKIPDGLVVAESLPEAVTQVDLIVNATSVGLGAGDVSLIDRAMLRPEQFVYDTIYRPAITPLLTEARGAGAKSANGLSMLLHQGSRAFELWFDRAAPVDEMRRALWLAADAA